MKVHQKHPTDSAGFVFLGSTQEEVFRDAKRLFRWYERHAKASLAGNAHPERTDRIRFGNALE